MQPEQAVSEKKKRKNCSNTIRRKAKIFWFIDYLKIDTLLGSQLPLFGLGEQPNCVIWNNYLSSAACSNSSSRLQKPIFYQDTSRVSTSNFQQGYLKNKMLISGFHCRMDVRGARQVWLQRRPTRYGGKFPLHLASRDGHLSILNVLLKNGANVSRKVCENIYEAMCAN